MVTPAEDYALQLLGAYLESVAALQALLELTPTEPDVLAVARVFQDQIAWETKCETALHVPLPAWAGKADAILPVALAVALGCLKHRRTPPTTDWARHIATADGLPPWATGLAWAVQGLVLLPPAGQSKLDRQARMACRRAIARLAALSAEQNDLGGLAELVEAELLSRDGASEAVARAFETACSRLSQSRFAALHRLALMYAGAYGRREGLPMASAAFAVDGAPWGEVGLCDRDLRAAMVATQALTAEGSSARVVERIVEALRQLGGACRVAFAIAKQGSLTVAIDTEGTPAMLPHRLLADTMRSSAPILVSDLSREACDDPYFDGHDTGSILCVFWQQAGRVSGAVLLENTATAHAFSADRVGIVHFLAATAAAALTHASLQTDMEAAIAQRIQSSKDTSEQTQGMRRSNSEMQMAGGFAHEMRNSLAATRFALASLSPCTSEDPPGSLDDDAALVQQCLATLTASASRESLGQMRRALESLKASQEAAQTTYAVISEGVDRGLHVAKAVMGFGRIAADWQVHTPTLLEPLLSACLAQHRGSASPASATWDVRVAPRLALPWSPKHITTVLEALLTNARDACAQRHTTAHRITIEATRIASTVSIRVADTGCGMAPDTQLRAFDPFFSTKGIRNLGLGLTMVRKIVHLYGGKVHAPSHAGEGATVEILLHGFEASDADARVAPTELAPQDRVRALEGPEAPLGREADIDTLAASAVPRRGRRVQICTVEGACGTGKTAMLHAVGRRLHTQQGVWFALAPHEKAPTRVGLCGIAQAVDALIRQMLKGPPQDVALWQRRVRSALGSVGGVLAQLVPVVSALVGPLPMPADLGPRAAENRLFTCFKRLFETIAEHVPLLLCIDDAQNMDPATVRLLQALDEAFVGLGALSYLMAYDPEESAPNRIAETWLRQLPKKSQATSHRLAAISRAPGADDVAADVIARIERLPEACRQLLSRAACIGNAFGLSLLQAIADAPEPAATHVALACEAGALTSPDHTGVVHFTHEKVRQHAKAALSGEQARAVHAGLARYMRNHRPAAPAPLWLCDLADHINAASAGQRGAFSPIEIADANLQAARSCYQSLSYAPCVAYLDTAIAALGESAWHEHMGLAQVALALKINGHRGLGDANAAEATVDLLVSKAYDLSQKIFAADKKADWQWDSGQHVQALDTHIARARLLGETVPKNPRLWQVALQRARFARAMWQNRETIASLAEKPFMTDAHQQAVVAALRATWLASALVRPALRVWTAYRLGELTLQQGVDKSTPEVLSALLTQAVREGRFGRARRWAACLRRLAERSEWLPSEAYVELCIIEQLDGLTEPPQRLIDRVEPVAQVLADNGDDTSAVRAYAFQIAMLSTVSLDAAARLADRKSLAPACLNDPMAREQIAWVATSLRALAQGIAASEGDAIHASNMEKRGISTVPQWMAITKFALAPKNAPLAYAAGRLWSRLPPETSAPAVLIAWQCLCICVSCTQFHMQAGRGKRLPRRFYQARSRLRGMVGIERCQIAGAGIFVDAEEAALAQDFVRASKLYEKAAAALQASGYVSFHALCCECAGRYFNQRGLMHVARAFIGRGCAAYAALGALHKSRTLKEEFALATAPVSLADTTLDGASEDAAQILGRLRDMIQQMAGDHSLASLAHKLYRWVHQEVAASRVVVSLGTPGTVEGVVVEGENTSARPRFLSAPQGPDTPLAVSNVAWAGDYAEDPYFAAHPCEGFDYVPIRHRAEVTGWIYCERAEGAPFTARTGLCLQLVAEQAALAVDRASAYQHLEREVQARTQDARQAQEALFEVAHDHAELQMAGGFAHEIRNAVASARFALSAAFCVDTNAPTALYDESRNHMAAAMDALAALEKSGGQDEKAAHALRARLVALVDNRQATLPLLRSIYEGVDRAMAVTAQVLEYAEAGRLVAGDHKTQVDAMLDELLRGVATDLQTRGVDLQVDIAPGLALPMREDHAFAILRNLLANARDAVCDQPHGVVKQRIILRAHGQAHQVVVSVADTGVGMSAASQANVFRPFFSTKGPQGTGLGLGLSRKLARLYGGDLQFSSKEGEGTTFTLSVPQLH